VARQAARGRDAAAAEPRPDAKLLAAAQRWLDVRLRSGPGAWPIDPGRVTIRA